MNGLQGPASVGALLLALVYADSVLDLSVELIMRSYAPAPLSLCVSE